MKVEYRHLDRTCLDEIALSKLLKRYTKNFKYDILFVFDLRIKDYGNYIFDISNNRHWIKISPNQCGFTDAGIKLEPEAEKYNLLATILHEVRHAQQYEKMGYKFWNSKFSCTAEIKNPDSSEYFSEIEVAAREFENKHILNSVEYYNRCMP